MRTSSLCSQKKRYTRHAPSHLKRFAPLRYQVTNKMYAQLRSTPSKTMRNRVKSQIKGTRIRNTQSYHLMGYSTHLCIHRKKVQATPATPSKAIGTPIFTDKRYFPACATRSISSKEVRASTFTDKRYSMRNTRGVRTHRITSTMLAFFFFA